MVSPESSLLLYMPLHKPTVQAHSTISFVAVAVGLAVVLVLAVAAGVELLAGAVAVRGGGAVAGAGLTVFLRGRPKNNMSTCQDNNAMCSTAKEFSDD